MEKFGDLRQRDVIYTAADFSGYIHQIQRLPNPLTTALETCYLLTEYHDGYKPGVLYILKSINGIKTWVSVDSTECGALVFSNSNLWKRVTADSVILHWTDPTDVVDSTDAWKNATWDHDVIVRKIGSVPLTIDDGEIVGYSSIRNQYNDNSIGFIDTLLNGETEYWYRVFAVTKGGIVSGTTKFDGSVYAPYGVRSSWSWPEIKAEIQANNHLKCFRVGDIFPMPEHSVYGTLHAQIVDFNKAELRSGSIPRSITFMTVEVIGNMSFDNQELEYAVTSDVNFKSSKEYFLKSSGNNYIRISLNPRTSLIDHTRATPKIGGSTSVFSEGVYELHKAIRYFKNNTTVSASDADKAAQLPTLCGCSSWSYSNIRTWLQRKLSSGVDITKYENKIITDPATGKVWSTQDPTNPSAVEWKSNTNGWFSASIGNYHDIAPASYGSATYIEEACFPEGFSSEFLSMLMSPAQNTITDQYVYRYNRSATDDLEIVSVISADLSYKGAERLTESKFWLPSYEQIFGKRPTNGINGLIDTTDTKYTSEGSQFEIFKNGRNRNLRVKYDLDGQPIGWYLRSCDPTTVGHVYYVGTSLPSTDGLLNETTCTAHRKTDGDDIRVGPAVCFVIAQ